MQGDDKAPRQVAETVHLLNAALKVSRMVEGATEEQLCLAVKTVYIGMLCTYVVDRQNLFGPHNDEVRAKMIDRVNAFEKDLLDKPF